MSIRLIARDVYASDIGVNQCWAKIYFDTDLSEYRVRFYRHAEYVSEADYFTSDKTDALSTARVQTLKGY
jgi:hypothetical protein